jgi:hypothetical protein
MKTRLIALAIACTLTAAGSFLISTASHAAESCDQHAGKGECLVPPPVPHQQTPRYTG